jgi:hypothetical protein
VLSLQLLLAAALALGGLLPVAGAARAESALRLAMPTRFGVVPASTYDKQGRRVGDATLAVEKLDNGNVRMFAQSGFDGAERNVVSAVLVPIDDGELQLVEQTSRSFDGTGSPLGTLTVDHLAAMGRCEPPAGNGKKTKTIELSDEDRVANIPVNLLFLPLARGQREKVDFEILLCSRGPKVVKARAEVGRRVRTEDGLRDIVEIHYEMNFGPVLSRLAKPFVPKVAVWFDPETPDGWLAHRMPLFAKGPTVMVVRTGIAPGVLDGESE